MKGFISLVIVFIVLVLLFACKTCKPGDFPPPLPEDSKTRENVRKIATLAGMEELGDRKSSELTDIIVKGLPTSAICPVVPLSADELKVIRDVLVDEHEILDIIESYQKFVESLYGKRYIAIPFLDSVGSPIGELGSLRNPVGDDMGKNLRFVAEKLGVKVSGTSFIFLYDIVSTLENAEQYYGKYLSDDQMKEVAAWLASFSEELDRIQKIHAFIRNVKNKKFVFVE